MSPSVYDPQERKAALAQVEVKYGAKEYAQAKKYAEIVFEENNPQVIEELLLLCGSTARKRSLRPLPRWGARTSTTPSAALSTCEG